MSDADMVKQARDFTERFGVENHAHWVPDGTSVVTIIAGLAQLLTETRTKALEEAAAVADAQSALDLNHSISLKNVSDFTGERFYRVASTTAAMVSKDIRSLKAEGGEK